MNSRLLVKQSLRGCSRHQIHWVVKTDFNSSNLWRFCSTSFTLLLVYLLLIKCPSLSILFSFTGCVGRHRRSQDFVWDALFSSKKLTTFFSRRPSKDGLKPLNKPPNIPCPARSVLQLTLALPGRCISCAGSASTKFPCKLRLIFFTALEMQVHPLHPLTTPMRGQKCGPL